MTPAAALLENRYGIEPAVELRAPGRVNLIGEHTDYSLLPVLPIAIHHGIDVAAAGATGPQVRAVSTEESSEVVASTDGTAAPPTGWGGYLHGVLRVLGERAAGRGARIAVSGDLPTTGGLSSSSALTVGMLAALNAAWRLELGAAEIVDLAIIAERFVGVESGGMDQTVIARAVAGSALRIDFSPPAIRPIPIPTGTAFVIGFSGTPAPKAGAAREHYNRSVVACRAAAALVSRRRGVDVGDPPLLGPLAAVAGEADIAGLPSVATAVEAAAASGADVGALVTLTAGSFPTDAPLGIRSAASHVLSEARRVDLAEAALVAGDVAQLGSLFDASHDSLRRFGAVTDGLDRVTAAAREAGAAGARVTGAGFGGWAVAVCSSRRHEAVAAAMRAATGGPAMRVQPAGGAL